MVLFAVVLVVISGFMNAVWNLFVKKSVHKQAYLTLIVIMANILFLPLLLVHLIRSSYPPQAYVLLVCSFLAQALYSWMLSKVYARGDLSQVYPIQRGTGVLLIPLISVIFMGEHLSIWGWMGVIVIITGIMGLSEWNKRGVYVRNPGIHPVFLAFGVGCIITTYVLIDKMTLQYVSPYILIIVSNFGFLMGNIRMIRHGRLLVNEWKRNKYMIMLGTVLMPGSYFLFLVAISIAPVSHLAPIREIGTVFAALLGIWILKEKSGIRRLIATSIILIGIIIIGMMA